MTPPTSKHASVKAAHALDSVIIATVLNGAAPEFGTNANVLIEKVPMPYGKSGWLMLLLNVVMP